MAHILISGYYGFDNLGDELLLTAILRQIRAVAPGSRITVLSAQPRVTEARHQVEAVSREPTPQLVAAVAKCDLLLSGGGSLLQDGTSRRSLWYYLGILALAQGMGRKTWVYSQGVGPLLRPLDRDLTRRVLERADGVVLRDRGSVELVRALGVEREVILGADPVLSLPLRAGKGDGTQVAWVIHGRYTSPRICQVMEEALKALSHRGITVWLFPFCPEEDGPVVKKLALWARVADTRQLWPRLRQCGLVVSMRLHGLILGAKLGMELIGITCDPKSDAFLEELGLAPGLEGNRLTSSQLVAAVEEAGQRAGNGLGKALEPILSRLEAGERALGEGLTAIS